MSGFLAPNIGRGGRIIRAVAAVALLGAAIVMAWHIWWAAVILGASGCFVLFEALRGWCFLRACGIKTKI